MSARENTVRIILPEDVLTALEEDSERCGIPVPMLAKSAIVRTYRTVSGDDSNPDKTTAKLAHEATDGR